MRFLCWEIKRVDIVRQLLEEDKKLLAIKIYRDKYPELGFREVLQKFYKKYLPSEPVPGEKIRTKTPPLAG